MPSKMINIGCGTTYHSEWINLDVSPFDPEIRLVDINEGLPFPQDFSTVCYCSHVLEHLDKTSACNLISEIFRVLQSGGVARLVVPDLEKIVREYLRILDATSSGDRTYEFEYDWIMLEMFDQAVRNTPCGEMSNFLKDINNEKKLIVRARIGQEAEKIWAQKKITSLRQRLRTLPNKIPRGKCLKPFRDNLAGWLVYLIAGKTAFKNFKIGMFKDSGEIHKWMYDRYSLKRLLEEAGFVHIKTCTAHESQIAGFEKYSLDVVNNTIRKPDSIYIEASKP
jgi:predicted SAM-dependent methyltransferase